jgi:hypothetical protein
MDTDVVHEHDVASLQGRDEKLFGIALNISPVIGPWSTKGAVTLRSSRLNKIDVHAAGADGSALLAAKAKFNPRCCASLGDPRFGETGRHPASWAVSASLAAFCGSCFDTSLEGKNRYSWQ